MYHSYTEMESSNCTLNYHYLYIIPILFIIILNILSIISLCINSYMFEKNICDSSNLWLYLLFSIFYNFFVYLFLINISLHPFCIKINNNILLNFLIILTKIGFIIWASIEFSNTICKPLLQNTLLYRTCCITLFSDTVMFICILFNIYYNYYIKKSISNNTLLNEVIRDDNDNKLIEKSHDDIISFEV